MNKALKYGCAACDTLIRKFTIENLPPERHFHYHQGVFLSGMQKIYKLCGDERYYNYIRDWVNYLIDKDGNIDIFEKGMLDDIQPEYCCLIYIKQQATKDIKRHLISS